MAYSVPIHTCYKLKSVTECRKCTDTACTLKVVYIKGLCGENNALLSAVFITGYVKLFR